MTMYIKLISVILLLFFQGALSSQSCDLESCDKDSSDEMNSECGCSVSREKKEDAKSEPLADDGKYSTHSNIKSPYPRTNQMVLIPAGSFIMGTNKPVFVADGEGPERKVTLSQFYLDKYEVSNSEFELFVNATGYVTEVKYFYSFFIIASQHDDM